MAIPGVLFGANWKGHVKCSPTNRVLGWVHPDRCVQVYVEPNSDVEYRVELMLTDFDRSVQVYEEPQSDVQYRVELIAHTPRCRPGTGYWRRLRRELENYAVVGKHPHVASFLDIDYCKPYICVKMEHAKYDLHDFMARAGGLKECVAQWLLLQLLHAVDYCHRKGVCNCDINPSNILVTFTAAKKPLLKLCSFSCSKQQQPGSSGLDLTSPIGDLAYLAPEILEQAWDGAPKGAPGPKPGSSSAIRYDGKGVDIWCLGLVLYYMLFRQMPFEDSSPQEGHVSKLEQASRVISRIKAASWTPPPNKVVSEQCREVLGMMLAPKETRCTLEQLWQHPWIREHLPANAIQFNAELEALQPEASLVEKLQKVLQHCETNVAK
jgi:serine/threonine-protein kinase SRK2